MTSALKGKKILLAITGGIAAYKAAELCRELKKRDCQVRVVMTRGAQEFITPLTLQALSGNPVHTELLDPAAELGMGHIELAKWPDLVLVAPATANFIARYAQGLADDLLGTLLLATTANVSIAPAMNQAMWLNALTQKNLKTLQDIFEDSLTVLGPASGEQACGDVGFGRMLEPLDICNALEGKYSSTAKGVLVGKKVVITAGPTREAIDPVRYISNHSSGKMGYALADSFAREGAEVLLVSGPTNLPAGPAVTIKSVTSAVDMMDAVEKELAVGMDIFVACAAVADYAPVDVASQKLKKQDVEGDEVTITLRQNPDIVASVASRSEKPFTVGFAAETQNLIQYARAKLSRKNLDMIIANDVSNSAIGFNSDQNAVHVITAESERAIDQQSKSALADQLISEIAKVFNGKGSGT